MKAEDDKPAVRPLLAVYHFPVRAGLWAELRLPVDLTEEEAKRLTEFLMAIAVNGEKA